MRITFIVDTFGGGGKERRCLQLIQGLNAAGITDIQFIIINNNIAYPEIYQTTADIHILDRKNKGMSHISMTKAIRLLLEDFSPDIVQVWGLLGTFYTNFIRLVRPFKYIGAYVADCNAPKGKNMLSNRMCALLSDKIVGNSLAGLKCYGIPEKKQVCIYNGYNPKRMLFMTEQERLDLKVDLGVTTNYVVMMVARVDRNKDYLSFIKLANNVCQERNDITFLAVGKGSMLEYYTQLCNEKYNGCVRFLGFRSDVDKLLEIADVTCLFSNSKFHGEGVSNSIMESMAHGVPVLATNAGGTPEIIKDGENGYLINNNDIFDSKNKLYSLLNDRNHYTHCVKVAKQCIEDKFNLKDKTAEYLQMYNLVINKA